MSGMFANLGNLTLGRKRNSAKPLAGGTPMISKASVAYTDTTAKNLFVLPKGAVIDMIQVNVVTAFDAGDSNVLDIGYTGTANAIKNDLAVGSAGQTITGWDDDELDVALAAATQYTATYVPAGTAPTAGLLWITFLWHMN